MYIYILEYTLPAYSDGVYYFSILISLPKWNNVSLVLINFDSILFWYNISIIDRISSLTFKNSSSSIMNYYIYIYIYMYIYICIYI